jgi:hypothetical protein
VIGSIAAVVILTAAQRPSNSPARRGELPRAPMSAAAPIVSTETLEVVVGDRLSLGLFRADVPQMRALMLDSVELGVRADDVKGADAVFVSEDTTKVSVTRSGELLARDAGYTTITATASGRRGSVIQRPVHAITMQQATNNMITEVCPNHDESTIRTETPIAPILQLSHEYHDCQGLIVASGDALEYGPTVGIFAGHATALGDWKEFANGRLVAIIMNFDAGKLNRAYDTLHIQPGTNCLILHAKTETEWEAAVIPQIRRARTASGGGQYDGCDERWTWQTVVTRGAPLLEVKRQTNGVDYQGRDSVPPVARWDWDARNRYNYIGVKCARAWCEIGPSRFVPSQSLPGPGSKPIYKGYYDEQLLADTAGKLSTVFGRIVPDSNLYGREKMKHSSLRWNKIAVLTFMETDKTLGNNRGSPMFEKYRKRYDAKIDGPASARTTMTTASSQLISFPRAPYRKDSDYLGRIHKSNLFQLFRLQYRSHPHTLAKMPPTVRWRWDQKDERTWSYCDPNGCCENNNTLDEK